MIWYIKDLERRSAEYLAAYEQKRAEEARAAVRAARDLSPLGERLAKLLATISPERQAAGLSIMDLQVQLRARGRGHTRCHVGELGDALRRAGFVRERRRWRGDDGFRAVWRRPADRTDG